MHRWVEIWTYVEDFGIPRWIEEWELEEEEEDEEEGPRQKQQEMKTEPSLAARRFASATHMPTGRDFLAFVADYFSLS